MALGRMLRTVRHLKPVQVTNRIWRSLRKPKARLDPPLPRREIGPVARPCPRAESLLGNDEVQLLGVARKLEDPSDWNRPDWPKLWLYGLHYHDGLRAEATPPAQKRAFVERWMAENPPLSGNGWEPYPLSLRIVNWIWWLAGEVRPDPAILASLAVQARALEDQLEYHLLGNHLWANAKGLMFAGLFFDGPEAGRWYAKGIRIAEAQRKEQFLADGGHFELSTTYHQLMTEDLLDLLNLSAAAERPLGREWTATAQRALEWLAVMTRPDGSVPLLNDAFAAAAPSTGALLDYAERLGLDAPARPLQGLTRLPSSGYARWTGDDFVIWVDVGRIGPDYIPGHGHADCFNFEIFADGRPVIVDTGVSTYEAGERRTYERGTSAHNTVTVGNADQAELWASFRVGRRPNLSVVTESANAVAAEHDGYDRVGARHRRSFEFGPRSLTVRDEARRSRPGPEATARFHAAPGVEVHDSAGGCEMGPLRIQWSGNCGTRVVPCEIATGFGTTAIARCLAIDFTDTLVTRIILP